MQWLAKVNMTLYSFLKNIYYRLDKQKRRRFLDDLTRKGLKLGVNVEIISTFFFDPSHCFLISIGDNCTICPNVRLIAHDASTKRILGYTKIGSIDIKASCFIGDSVIVLPNVSIGPNTIIGAGSVVTRDIPPNTIAAGNPARVISSVDAYIERMTSLMRESNVFDEAYLMRNLDVTKREEVIRAVGKSIGFIV